MGRLKDIRTMRRYGIANPIITYREANRAGVELAVVCAVLEQETGGGRNVFGHDPTIFKGAGKVTKAKYLRYKKARDAKRPRRMQGVGPMQLTWYGYQNLADKYGGCWKPRPNIQVGCEILARQLKKYGYSGPGLRSTFKVYNGSWKYALAVETKVTKWRRRLYVEPRQGFGSLHESLWRAYSLGRRRGFTDLGTYARKPGSHGYRPAFAFDLGDPLRFKFLGWGYLKARRLAKRYAKHADQLRLEYILLGHKMLHRENRWKPVYFADRDGSHKFHIHVDGIGPDDRGAP